MLSPTHNYYCHIPGYDREPYATSSSFVEWVFPHGALPSDFKSSAIAPHVRASRGDTDFTEAVTERGGSYRNSFYWYCVELIYLVSTEESEWSTLSIMFRFK